MTTGNKIRSGALWSFMGSTGSQIISFVFGIVLARMLAPEVFGMLLTIQVFTGVAGFIAGAGMGQALVRAKDTSRADYDIVFTLQMVIGCLICAIFFFSAPIIAGWYDTPVYSDLIRVSALSFLFRPFNNVPASILHREMRFKDMVWVRFLGQIASSLSCIALAYYGFGVWALILGGMVAPLITIPLFSMQAKWRPALSLNIARAKDIARYGMMVSVTDIIVYARTRVSALMLSRSLGPAAVGLYNKGESLADMPNNFITGSVYQVLFRTLAAEQDNLDRCRYLFFRSITLVAVYGTPFYIGLLWLSEPLIRGVYGEKWVEAAGPLLILIFAWPFWLLDMLSGAVLAAFAWLHREVVSQTATLIVTCITILIGLDFGIKGVAWALVFSAAFSAIFMHTLAIRCLKAHWLDFVRALAPAAVLNSTLAASLFLFSAVLPAQIKSNDYAYLVVLGGLGAIVYALSFLYLPIKGMAAEQNRWKEKLGRPLKPKT